VVRLFLFYIVSSIILINPRHQEENHTEEENGEMIHIMESPFLVGINYLTLILIMKGWWEHGIPIGPFESMERGTGNVSLAIKKYRILMNSRYFQISELGSVL
jgi:hypothetical protein